MTQQLRPPPRVDASMTLLSDIAHNALDPGYGDVAARRTAPTATDGGSRRWLSVAAAFLAAGVLTVAAVHARQQAPSTSRERARLLAQAEAQTRATDQLAAEVDGLRRSVDAQRSSVLSTTAQGSAVVRQLDALESALGLMPRSGAGLRVRLDDAANAAEAGSHVLDRDLQDVVNALWAAGAVAVAVDGQRVTSDTAIRTAGSAILVGFRPVSAPYDIVAIGDPTRLESSFGRSAAVARMSSYVRQFGLRFRYGQQRHLAVPAAATPPLLYARAATPSPTAAPAARRGPASTASPGGHQ